MPKRLRDGSARPAKGVASVWAVAVKPAGSRVIESPWLIQTGCSVPRPASSRSPWAMETTAGPYSRFGVRMTSPPSSMAMSCAP